jgi:hypothetical protein
MFDMFELMERTWLRDGCIIPFNKELNRIELNKVAFEAPTLEEFPRYILVMVPYGRPYFSNCEVSTDGFEFGTFDPDFVHEWMPRIKSEGVGSVTIFGGKRTPYVGSVAHIKDLANSGKCLMNHIYRLTEVAHDTCDGTVSLRYRALPLDNYDAHAVECIQHWLRDLLCLPEPRAVEPTITGADMLRGSLKRLGIVSENGLPWLDGMRRPSPNDIDGDVLVGYCRDDVLATMEAFKYFRPLKENNMVPGIKKVIFNKPATIVLWEDGTKTIVRTQGKARFDKEKGLAMCIAKKALGNKGNYYDEFRKWVK